MSRVFISKMISRWSKGLGWIMMVMLWGNYNIEDIRQVQMVVRKVNRGCKGGNLEISLQ